MNSPSPYRKDALISARVARGLLTIEPGGRIPTILEYTQRFGCSRGVVQNALLALEQSGAAVLDKRGKKGTFLAEKDESKLFENGQLPFITGSMPAPLNLHLAGLATGICQAMTRCPAPFTFAFVQGSANRADALRRGVYDFAVVTLASAKEQIARCPELDIAFPLARCRYSLPYMLYLNRKDQTGLWPGITLAVDPKSTDQWSLTKALCEGEDVRLLQLPFLATWTAFLSGEADGVVQRGEMDTSRPGLYNMPYLGERQLPAAQISATPIQGEAAEQMQQPVVLVSRENMGIGPILAHYLDGEFIAYIQRRVLDYQMTPQFY